MALDEQLLDDPDALEAADPRSVLRSLAGAGAQVRQALSLTQESLPATWADAGRPRAVVVAARGGAAVVADALAAVVGGAGPVPVLPLSGSRLPSWVGSLDVVIAISLSGRAEGAVSVASEAGRRGSQLLTVGAAGSLLEQVSGRFRGAHVPLPVERSATTTPTSRTALWSLLTGPLLACDRLGLLPEDASGGEHDLAAVADALDAEAEACRPSSESFVNPAKALALEVDGSVPVILGDSPLAGVAGRRAASVLARTARVPAVHGMLPDDAGDVVATFGGPFASDPADEVFADPFLDGPAATRLRLLLLDVGDGIGFDAVRVLAERSGVRVSDVRAHTELGDDDLFEDDGRPRSTGPAETPMQRFARVVARVDFAATYLALATGLDPATSPHVAELRDSLR